MLNSVGQVQVTLQLVQLTSSNQKFVIYTGGSLGCPFVLYNTSATNCFSMLLLNKINW